MDEMFLNCQLIKEITLTNFNDNIVHNHMKDMFTGCSSLKKIDCSAECLNALFKQ